jgi:hypothetical protein
MFKFLHNLELQFKYTSTVNCYMILALALDYWQSLIPVKYSDYGNVAEHEFNIRLHQISD